MEGRRHLPARRSLLFWPIQNASALLTLLCFALQPQVTGEPITGIQRSCVSGQLCVISGLTGTGLGNGDRIVLSQECGAAAVTAGMPGSFGESMGATSSGTYFRWSTYLQADGAEYRICWCSIALQCTSPERFTLDIGTMTLTGPQGDLPETCYSGRACVIDNIEGVYLRDGDTIMVLDACNERGIAVEGFPNNAITTTGAVAGTEHGWGEAKVTAVGGVYMLCWCAKGATCIEVGDHRKQVGSLTLVGPGGGFNKACSVFEACTWSGMIGQGVADGDRIMILEACGTGLAVAGFPNSDIAEASGGGGTYTFGSTDNVVIAGGAEYAMCWCQAAAGYVCAGPSNFITRAGTLIVSGPRSDHEYACKKGSPCEVHNFQGIGLVDGDKIKILIECGTGSSPSGFPANGEAVASNGGASYLTWAATATNAQFGSYRICWCKAAWGCSSSADFKMDAGAFRVVGVNAGLSRSCHAQAPCQISGITGSNLRNGDLITIMTSCGSGGQEVPGWPQNGTSFPATGSGTSFNWGFSEAVQAPVGTYKMCWCPANDYSGCDEPADFTAEAGTIELRGPERQSTNATCVAWQEPSCLLGPFRFGVGLTYGTDKIMFVRSTETCGVNQPDPDVGAGLAGKLVEGDMMVYMDAAELPYGGVWKMCYCANFDSGLDQEATACSSKEDFSAEAGLLSVQGAYPGQAVNCTRNQVCSFTLAGYGLSKDLHQIAIADSASFCGQRSPTTAESVRRRRDFTGNPYLPADLTGSGDLAFNVDPVQALGAFAICFCVPAPSSGACEANSLRMFHQSVGHFDIRGAAAGQSFECGRGGPCTLLVQGRGLSALDRVKIVNSSTACDGDAQQDGFFRSLVPAEPAPGTNSTQARFALGRVTLGGSFKVCYCANLDGCSSLAKYTHQAGVLDVTDPLSNLTLVTSTSASVTVSVESRVASSASIVRCAISEFEPRFMPTSADLKNGLTAVGLGKGESTGPTKLGTNFVEMFFSTFVKPTQAYRVWCVEASAQSFILPSSPGGTLFVTPQGIVTPTLRVFPGFLWPQAKFFAELYQVYNAAVTPGRRLAAATQVRIQTGASEFMCNGMDYDIAVPMRVVDAGQAGQSNAVLSTETELEASQFRLFLCFFAGPNATGIALSGDRLTVQSEAPTITIKRMDGLVLQKLYRGLLLQAIVSNAAVEAGLLHWTTASGFATNGCDGASRAPPAAQAVQNGETWFFTMQAPTGQYVLCYLGKLTEGSTTAPFNGLGEFDLVDIVESVSPANSPMSTRSTVRLTLKVRMPGSVTCIARNQPTDVRPTDFAPGVVHEGRAVLTVEPPTDGVDPEFSREFQLSIALISYQRSGLPLRVWCLHSLAEEVVFPETRDGILVPLQVDEAFVTAQPAFIWNGAKFRLTLSNTQNTETKFLGMNEPALPSGWELEIVAGSNGKELRYIDLAQPSVSHDEHPSFTAWKAGAGPSLCDGSNSSTALTVTDMSNTRTSSWFTASSTGSFVCFWGSPMSYPHFTGKLDILAQAPERILEVSGQTRRHVYRGVNLVIRIRYASSTGGRVLIVRKADFDKFGQNCQDMTEVARRLGPGEAKGVNEQEFGQQPVPRKEPWPLIRKLQASNESTSSPSQSCTSSPRRTSELKLLGAEDIFPTSVWGVYGQPGLNCTRDFRIYWNPALVETSVLANKDTGRYIMVTSNASVFLHFVPRVRMLTENGGMPNVSVAVVFQDMAAMANYTDQQWAMSTRDCTAKILLDTASPMYQEGAENLPLSQYLEAELPLEGFNFMAVVYMPNASTVIMQEAVCGLMQPPPPPPPREELVTDIDKPGLGRTVQMGMVLVPALLNGTGSTFLHTDPLGEYIMCYTGNEKDEMPIFNPIGSSFKSVDVLSSIMVSQENRSDTRGGYVNVTSWVPGVTRCIARLSSQNPPQVPNDIFKPDPTAESFLGSSDLVQFDLPGESKLVTLRLDEYKVSFMSPATKNRAAPPAMYVWCAHEGSTVIYPPAKNGLIVEIQARSPPKFVFKQFNQTTTELALNLNLEFTPVETAFSEVFPLNLYDTVEFQSRPAMPGGLELDKMTGAIRGIPNKVGTFKRNIIAVSKSPPSGSSSTEMTINVQDVLGLTFRHATADGILLSIAPRSTNIFVAQKVFLLTKPRTSMFTKTPDEFFCVRALDGVEYRNVSTVICRVKGEACCCASYVLTNVPIQDIRILSNVCGFSSAGGYHTFGLVEGLLSTSNSQKKAARLLSSSKVEATVPPEVVAEAKKPVSFDLVMTMPFEDYSASKDAYDAQLIAELSSAVTIPQELVHIKFSEAGRGGVVFGISFYMEPRCLQNLGNEVELLSFGINTKEGCNLVAPVEYMNELQVQLSDSKSALFYRSDLDLLLKVDADKSFGFSSQVFCNKEPLWEYGAVASTADECPFDMIKLGGFGLLGVTVGVLLLLAILSRLAGECGSCQSLTKARLLDVLTPLMGLYKTVCDYAWLAYLKANGAHPLHDTIFMVCLCILFLCFVVNAAALRITITTYIVDTPWWRKNRKRLRLILLLSVLSPRFFRITRSHLGSMDRTHIHFGTPSKMAVVFSNLGLVSLMQDIPLIMVQGYVWLIWRNLAPKVSLLCFLLAGQSIATAALHHAFSRSQRAAYERVVKLLGVRRLTAGFFDVSAGVGEKKAGKGVMDGMRLGNGQEMKDKRDPGDNFRAEDITDPSKLDPIQAAMYVAQMYEKESRRAEEMELEEDSEEEMSDGSDDEDDDAAKDAKDSQKAGQNPLQDPSAKAKGGGKGAKTLYSEGVYEKMRKFYAMHDPAKFPTIGRGTEPVDEQKLDADLKKRFGVGLESVT